VVDICARKLRCLGKLALREAALLTELRHKLSEICATDTLFFLSSPEGLLATTSIMPESLLAGNVSFLSGLFYNYHRQGDTSCRLVGNRPTDRVFAHPTRQGELLFWLREELLRNV
jgi:hypothetical protein